MGTWPRVEGQAPGERGTVPLLTIMLADLTAPLKTC